MHRLCRNTVAVAAAYARRPNSRTSRNGSARPRSQRTSAAATTTDTAPSAAAATASRGIRNSVPTKPPSTAVVPTAPTPSRAGRRSTGRSGWIASSASSSAAPATGRLARKIVRQPATATSTPPSGGPIAAARPSPEPNQPNARPRSPAGIAARKSAAPFGIIVPPAIACPTRKATTSGNCCARAAAAEHAAKPSRPPRNARR